MRRQRHATAVGDQPPRSTCNVDLVRDEQDLAGVASAIPTGALAVPSTACTPSWRVRDYADFVSVNTAATSAFGSNVGIIRISA
jgi:hypothetical protein